MKNQYVSKTLNEFLGESNSITLKRKYGERPTVTAGANAPLRNQVLSFVAENRSVSKADLKRFILGLREGGSTVAAANMFIKRNARYFVAESRDGVTYFKLSNLGQRLIDRSFPSKLSVPLTESADDEFEEKPELDAADGQDADGFETEGPADEVGYGEDPENVEKEDDVEETVEDEIEDLKARVAELEETVEQLIGGGENGEDEDVPEDEHPEDDDIGPADEDNGTEETEKEENEVEKCTDKPRKYDFKDKGRPGLQDVDETTRAQFVSHKLAGKKSPNLGGKLDPKLHDLLTDKQDKDENELDEDGPAEDQKMARMRQIIENLRNKDVKLNEADEADELQDKDLDTIDTTDKADKEEPKEDETGTTLDGEPETEKVEITEFIITVEDVDAAIDELGELGITAERVPLEPKEEEVPAETEEPAAEVPAEGGEKPAEEAPAPEASPEVAKESLAAFVRDNYLNEEGEKRPADPAVDLGSSDELGLGDQGEEAKELGDTGEQPVEPTAEFEEKKIKVKAEDWDVLKGWLESKSVDVRAMFGGDIETEEVSPEEAAAEETGGEEISDEDIDFTGVGDKDGTKVEAEKTEECTECEGKPKK